MQSNLRPSEQSLGVLLVDRLVEQVIFHNADLITGTRTYDRLIGTLPDDDSERAELIAFLTTNLAGARNIDEIVDFKALKMAPHPVPIQAALQAEAAREADRQAAMTSWRMPPQRVWESVSLFGRRFEPLSYKDVPTIELPAREWFNSLHLLPNEGILLSTGERVTFRLTWTSYFGSVETNNIAHLKKEAESLASTKLWEAGEWAKEQVFSPPDLDDDEYQLSIVERQYAVSPLSGAAINCYGTVGIASYKSDSGDPQPWRSPADATNVFITHWFKTRDGAEKCLAYTESLLHSLRSARLRSTQKKQASDVHKTVARRLQAKLRLFAATSLLVEERRIQVTATLAEIEPLLDRTKSSSVIRWSTDAELLVNRLIRESMTSDEAAQLFVDALFELVLERTEEGELQNQAVESIDQIDSLHKSRQLRNLENRSAKLDEVLFAVIQSMGVEIGVS